MEKVESGDGLRVMLAEERPRIDPRRMVVVGLCGAVVSVGLYYFYNMLHEDTREKIKDQVTSLIKSSLQKIALD